MSEAKHTPAPWHFLEEGDTESDHNIGKPFTICGGDDDDLADVFDNTHSTVSISREEAIANARLIAAAPDLLAALKACAALLDGNLSETAPFMTRRIEIVVLLAQCTEALKKAEGRS
jgi:hypothetical protein